MRRPAWAALDPGRYSFEPYWRSAFLQELVRRELGWPDPVAFDAAVDRGRRALAAAGALESAELIRAERRRERDRHR